MGCPSRLIPMKVPDKETSVGIASWSLSLGFTGPSFVDPPGSKPFFSNFSVLNFNIACVTRFGSGSGVAG